VIIWWPSQAGRPVMPAVDAETMTPFVVTWFRIKHSKGGRRTCRCWICSS
jgi:hypothetical protein